MTEIDLDDVPALKGAMAELREVFAKVDERRSALISQARAQYCNDDIEIDDEPELSETDDGAWVAAWVWVANAEIEEEPDEEDIPPIEREPTTRTRP